MGSSTLRIYCEQPFVRSSKVVSVSARALDFPLWIPINKVTENTVDALFNRFEEVVRSFIYLTSKIILYSIMFFLKVSQSAPKGDLFGMPFRMEV